jgi:hypothetical protein
MVDRWLSISVDALKDLSGFYGGSSEGTGPRVAAMLAEVPPSATLYPGLPEAYRRCVEHPWSGEQDRILAYKARPLTGIWATAPYLHNGSVASLYELLLPAGRRRRSFFLGSRQFDPVNVGYVTDRSAENRFEFDSRDARGDIVWGNFNGGHDYGNAALTDAQRYDLIEFMKTL